MSDWYVYILQCADQTFYTGVCLDPQRRVTEHNTDNRLAARYTRSRRPVTLVYQESCPDRSQACRREVEIKRLSRTRKQQLIHAKKRSGRYARHG